MWDEIAVGWMRAKTSGVRSDQSAIYATTTATLFSFILTEQLWSLTKGESILTWNSTFMNNGYGTVDRVAAYDSNASVVRIPDPGNFLGKH